MSRAIAPNNFGSADRVLLEGVAAMLARFLTGRGKVLVRHARERQRADRRRSAQPRARSRVEYADPV